MAPDLQTLLDLESAIEPACRTQLAALGINTVEIQQGQGIVTSGRVDVQLTMGAARDTQYVPANLPDGPFDSRACFENSWNATLTFTVITNRDTNGQFHANYRAKIRSLLIQFFSQFPSSLLPYHEITYVRSAGTTLGLVSTKDEDVSQLRYACVISIRPGAWPAPY